MKRAASLSEQANNNQEQGEPCFFLLLSDTPVLQRLEAAPCSVFAIGGASSPNQKKD